VCLSEQAALTSLFCMCFQASVMKPALACLSTVLAAMDANDWPTASLPFSVLLSFSLSPRPKVRKRAHDGLLQVLASVQGTPVMAAASAALLQGLVCSLVNLSTAFLALGSWPFDYFD
jgi:hypothetical protein